MKSLKFIRWGAVIPLASFVGAIVLYFVLFFDLNMKAMIEWVGYKSLGREVNVGRFHTSFISLSMEINDLQITSAENPQLNSVQIGSIRFSALWDALLKVKFVVNEMAVEKVAFQTKRAYPGKIAPPEPPKPDTPSFFEKEGDHVKALADEKIQAEGQGNLLGNMTSFLSGSVNQAEVVKMVEALPSREMISHFEREIQAKQSKYQASLKELPQQEQLKKYEKDLASIKTRDFANVDEVRKSLEQFAEVVKSADGDFKKVQSVTQSLSADLAETQKNLSLIDEQIKKDLSGVQKQLNIPQIDAKSLSRAILMKYISDKLGPYQKYIKMAQKYLPEKGSKKKESSQKEDPLFQPHVRAKGITYEFGHPGAYPLVWIKKVSIDSKAGSTPDAGNLSGQITDITSHQRLIGKPTMIDIQGDFPVQKISRVFVKGQLNQLVEPSLVTLKAGAEGIPVEPRVLVDSGNDKIELRSASMLSSLDFELKGVRKLNARIQNQLSATEFGLSTSNDVVKTLFDAPLKAIQKTVLAIILNGELPEINVDFESDLGTQLEAGVRAQIQAKVNEAKKQVEKAVEEFIGMRKRAIDTQAGVLQDQVKGEVGKVQEQINKIKTDAESRSNEAKRETENKAKKKLEDEGKKLLEDMKKNFKLGN